MRIKNIRRLISQIIDPSVRPCMPYGEMAVDEAEQKKNLPPSGVHYLVGWSSVVDPTVEIAAKISFVLCYWAGP